jgi:hypothetical protein
MRFPVPESALISPRLLSAAALSLLSVSLASPAVAFDQREVGPAYLPPITRDHGAKIGAWGAFFFADPQALAGSLISSPVLTRDGTGRLLWLVCLEAPHAGPDPRTGGVQRHAFGFAPNYFSAPQERRRATLTRDYCDERPLAWRPLQRSVRVARRR